MMYNSRFSSGRRPSRRNADINITNLMDVMMVLLVVFMVAAPLMTSGIALDLPKVGGKYLKAKKPQLTSALIKTDTIISVKRKFRLIKLCLKLRRFAVKMPMLPLPFPAIPCLNTAELLT